MFKFLRNLNLAFKLNAILMLILGVLFLTILFVLTNRTAELTSNTGQLRVLEEAEVIQQRFAEAEADVLAKAELMASSTQLVAALNSGDKATVQRFALLRTIPFGLDDLVIVDAEGENVTTVTEARTALTEAYKAELFNLSLLGIDATGIIGSNGDLQLVGTAPVRNQAGEIVGAVLASRLINDAFMAEVNFHREDVHIGLAYDGQVMANDADSHGHGEADHDSDAEEEEALDFDDLLDSPAIGQALNGQTVAPEQILYSAAGTAHLAGYTPLTVGGDTEAVLILQTHVEELISFREQLVRNVVVIVAILALAALGIFFIFVSQTVTQPIGKLATAAREMGAGNLTTALPSVNDDEVGQLANSFGQMAGQLRGTLAGLEQRTQALTASAEISRRLSTILDEQELVTAVVTSLQQAFNYYHVHIYLLNQAGNSLEMAGGTGEVGAQLLAQNHAIAMGSGLVGSAAQTNTTTLVPDITQSENWVANPLLPDTRSEIAAPIAIGDKVLGVLDVQSNVTNGLQQPDQELLQSITNQVAIALQNARQYDQVKQSQQSIQERETLLRTIIDSTPDWIFVKDLEHRYLMVNQGYADSFNITPNAFIGKNDLDIGFPEEIVKGDPEKGIRGFWADDREIMEQGEVKIIEAEPAVVDGEERFLNTIKAPLKNAAGTVTGVVGFVHDITKLKQIEVELQDAQTRTQEVLESITVPLVISKISDGTVAYVNEPLAKSIRVPRDELMGQQTPDFYHDPADRQKYLAALREHGVVENFDLHLKRGDGELFWALISGRVIEFQGEPAIINSVIDINERRQAQETVARRAVELETVSDVGAVAATILEPNELLQQVVDLAKERFGLYHSHIYLLDEGKKELSLTSGAGDVGRTMVTEKRQISLSQEQSLVARAARTQKGVVINDVQAEPGFLPHPLLPDTQAEMAVPLIAGSEVQGVLDVQANSVNRFTAEDISIFTTLASQIAISLQNARRYAEAQRALDELTRLQRIMAREGWEAFLLAEERPLLGYSFNVKGAKPIASKENVMAKDEAATETDTETVVAAPDSSVSIPIAVRGETIGQLGLRSPDGQSIPERKQALLETIAIQVSEALEQARLTEQTEQALIESRRQSEELSYINKTVASIATLMDVDHTMQIVLDSIAEALQVQQVRVALLEEDGKTAKIVAEHYDPNLSPSALNLVLPIEHDPITQEVIATRKPAVIDVANDKRLALTREQIEEQGIKTIVLLPMLSGNRVIGTVGIDLLEEGQTLTAEQIRLAETIVLQAATAVQNARQFDRTEAALAETQRRSEELALINQVIGAVTGSLDMSTNLYIIAEELAKAISVSHVGIALMSDDKTYLEVFTEYPPPEAGSADDVRGQRIPIEGNALTERAIETKKFAVAYDAQNNPMTTSIHDILRQRNIHGLGVLPMVIGDEIFGTVAFDLLDPDRVISEEQMRLAETLVYQASIAFQSARLFEQTQAVLEETEALYEGSENLVLSNSEDDVLKALTQSTMLQNLDRANLFLFDEPVEDGIPRDVHAAAVWVNEGVPKTIEVGTRFLVDQVPFMAQLRPDTPMFVQDVREDERVDEKTAGILESFGMRSFVLFPLVVGNQWLGLVSGQAVEPVYAHEAQVRRSVSLVNQAAVVMKTTLLFRQEQARASREQLLREIAAKVRGSTDVDTIMRTAVTEIGRTLGRKSFIKLGKDQNGNSEKENGATS